LPFVHDDPNVFMAFVHIDVKIFVYWLWTTIWMPLAYVGINGYKLPTRTQICEWNGFLKDYLWNLTLKELNPLFSFAKIKLKFKWNEINWILLPINKPFSVKYQLLT
jgi:hypothetical protein